MSRPAGGTRPTRTIFNLLGPMSNPAGKRQLVGVFDRRWVRPMAEVLGRLGRTRLGGTRQDGLDEITTTTELAAYKDGQVTEFEVAPEDAGLQRAISANSGRRAGAQRGADARSAGGTARRVPRHRGAQQRRRR